MDSENLKRALIAAGVPAASIAKDLDSVYEGVQGSQGLIIDEEIEAEAWQEEGKIVGVVIYFDSSESGAYVTCEGLPDIVEAVLQARRQIQEQQKGQKCTLH